MVILLLPPKYYDVPLDSTLSQFFYLIVDSLLLSNVIDSGLEEEFSGSDNMRP